MKNIRTIFRGDLRRATSSVVAIVTLLGLCVVPCLYAWFNIFSNWDPYGPDATSRIPVAVASEDAGVNVLGLNINVGEQIISALQSNDSIGWVFVDSSAEALEGVNSSDCYAALIVPEDFSQNVVSFLSGSLTNPQLQYYENEKKNAIAPKITGKAKTAVQEQVNATFVQTLATYLTDAASIARANGIDAKVLLQDLSDKLSVLDERLDACCVLLDATAGLTNSAQGLLQVSGKLLGDAEYTVSAGQELLNQTDTALVGGSVSVTQTADAVRLVVSQLGSNLDSLYSDLDTAFTDLNRYNAFIYSDLSSRKELVSSMLNTCTEMAADFEKLGLTGIAGQFTAVSEQLGMLYRTLDALQTATEDSWSGVRAEQQEILRSIRTCRDRVTTLGQSTADDLEQKLQSAITSVQDSVDAVSSALSGFGGTAATVSSVINGYVSALETLKGGILGTRSSLQTLRQGLGVAANLLQGLAGSSLFDELTGVLADDSAVIARYIASPVQMDTEILYETREYGSAMAPFYTVLAQWVGSLLCATFLKVKVKPREGLAAPRPFECFFGRYGMFLLVGLAQALIVSLGDLWYVGIQCLHPFRFVLAACVCGLTFSMINYALVFALDNIGMALGVIILVVQVAGAGGTYPVEVLPQVFQRLYAVMPFHYGMDAMRETVAGLYGNTYWASIGILLLFAVGAVVFGLVVYFPARKLNQMIASSKKKSEIML